MPHPEKRSALETAGHLQIVAAFDMRVPADVAALNSIWQFTPVEKAEHRVHGALSAIKDWCARYLTSEQRIGLLLSSEVSGLSAERAAELNALRAAVDMARADLALVKAEAAKAWVRAPLSTSQNRAA